MTKQHRQLGAPGGIRGEADEDTQANDNHSQPGDGACKQGVARWNVGS